MLRVPGHKMRELLNRVPRLGEKFMNAFTLRRKELTIARRAWPQGGGSRAIAARPTRSGSSSTRISCPSPGLTLKTPEGQIEARARWAGRGKFPVVELGDGKVLLAPFAP